MTDPQPADLLIVSGTTSPAEPIPTGATLWVRR